MRCLCSIWEKPIMVREVVVKIMVPFWVLLQYGTYYLGYPKRDHNFDNYPYESMTSDMVILKF